MKIIVSYDVSLTTPEGKRRLRRVARVCKNYGLRVQNSVFECEVDWSHLLQLQEALTAEMDTAQDSIRIYNLGNKWDGKVIHYGIKEIPDLARDILLL